MCVCIDVAVCRFRCVCDAYVYVYVYVYVSMCLCVGVSSQHEPRQHWTCSETQCHTWLEHASLPTTSHQAHTQRTLDMHITTRIHDGGAESMKALGVEGTTACMRHMHTHAAHRQHVVMCAHGLISVWAWSRVRITLSPSQLVCVCSAAAGRGSGVLVYMCDPAVHAYIC